MVKHKKKERKKNKYHKVYPRRHNSPIEVFDIPSGDGEDTNLEYGNYLLSLVPYEDSDEGVVAPPVSVWTQSERAYFHANESK